MPMQHDPLDRFNMQLFMQPERYTGIEMVMQPPAGYAIKRHAPMVQKCIKGTPTAIAMPSPARNG
jgi:hypothetical protein